MRIHLACIVTMLLLFLGAEWIVDPTVDSPLNDDWSYAHSVLQLQQTGKIDIGYWPAMTLVAHILWGNCFVSLFGFSHLVLRISTLCLSAVTIVLLYILLFRLSRRCLCSVFTTLFLVFNPIWFLLSNSFMTDVPFLFAVTLALYSAQQVITKNNNFHLLVFSVACMYALLIRQFGMALPVAWFIFTCFSVITRRIRLRQAVLYLVPVLLSALTYLVFERWVVDHLPEGSAYQSASRITKDLRGICSKFSENFVHRFSQSLLYLGLFLLPLTAYGAYARLKEGSWRQGWLLVIPAVAVSVLLVRQLHQFPIGNSLYNCGLGLQSVYDVTVLQTNTSHTYSAFFESGVEFFGMLGAVGLLILMTSGIRPMIRPLAKDQVNHAFDGFLVLMAQVHLTVAVAGIVVVPAFFREETCPGCGVFLPV